MRALALLSWWQLKNSIRTLFTEPKKLIPFVLFAFLIGFQVWFYFFPPHPRGQSRSPVASFVTMHTEESRAALFVALAAGALYTLSHGFTGRALTFSLADVDYLFPSPISRRAVLAYKLPSLMQRQVFGAGAVVYMAYIFLWRHAPEGAPSGAVVWQFFLAAAFYLAFYSNLSIALEVLFGLGRAALGARLIQAAIAAILLWAGFAVWREGLGGLVLLERNAVFATVFYPCRLMARVCVAPLVDQPIGGAVAQLALLGAASVAAALWPRGNYYEATLDNSERFARVRQAAREGNAFAAWSARREHRNTPEKDFSRPYALEPFGHGAMAVFWAHLTAMAKRPLANFAGPFVVGLAISACALVWLPRLAFAIPLGVGGYALLLVAASGWKTVFRAHVERRPLMRALPLAPWRLALADVGAAAIPGILIAWGAGLALLAGSDVDRLSGALMLVCAPPLIICVLLAAYAVAFLYPKRSDSLAMLIGMLVMGLANLVLLAWFLLLTVPFILIHRPGLLALSVPIGCAIAAAVLAPLAGDAFARAEE